MPKDSPAASCHRVLAALGWWFSPYFWFESSISLIPLQRPFRPGQISLRWPCPRPLSTFHLVLWPWLWLRAVTDWCQIDGGGPAGGRGGDNTLTWLKDGFTRSDFNRAGLLVMMSPEPVYTQTPRQHSANRCTEGDKRVKERNEVEHDRSRWSMFTILEEKIEGMIHLLPSYGHDRSFKRRKKAKGNM